MDIEQLQTDLAIAQGQLHALNHTLIAVIQGLPRLACAHGALTLAIEVETHEATAAAEGLSPIAAAASLGVLTAYRNLLEASGQ